VGRQTLGRISAGGQALRKGDDSGKSTTSRQSELDPLS